MIGSKNKKKEEKMDEKTKNIDDKDIEEIHKQINDTLNSEINADKQNTANKEGEEKPEEKLSAEEKAVKRSKIFENKTIELKDSLLRMTAEFDNYRKRTTAEMEEFRKFANQGLIKKLLGTLDNFELAFNNKSSGEEFIKGMEMIFANLVSTLEEEGVKIIDTKDAKYDHNVHEALMAEVVDGVDKDIVVEEFQKGYTYKGKVLRHSKVKVSK